MDPEGIVKQASGTDLDKAAALLETIREENPKLWPNGLTVDHFSPGNLWLIQKSASDSPVGFVGWQSRKVDGVPTGYYSIGVLPEYRHQGIAKKAVAQLLATKAASVDCVRALVVPGNTFSERLARSLDVPVEKAAGWGDVGRFVSNVAKHKGTSALAGGLGTVAFHDQVNHPEESMGDTAKFWKWDKYRKLIGLENLALGALGGATGHNAATSALSARGARLAGQYDLAKSLGHSSGVSTAGAISEMMVAPIIKDTVLHSNKAIGAVSKMPEAISGIATSISGAGGKPSPAGLGTKGALGAAALLALALGGGAYGISRALGKQKGDQQQQMAGGRLKVTLPTKNPTDSETTIDLPFDQFSALSPALRQRIERDTRRRLHAETNARTRRIGTQPLTAVA